MLSEELISLVESIRSKKCELQNVELKKAAGGTPERLYDSLSSFSNQSGGGIIIFGIDESSDYAISGVYDSQDLMTKVTNQALQMHPVVRPLFTVAQIDGKWVVSAEIAECDIFDKPCFYSGAGRLRGSYVRVGESDQPMTEYEIYSYESYKRKIQDEINIVERADLDAYDDNALTEYFVRLRQDKHNLSQQPVERIMQMQGLTDKGKPTLAGIMLFGKYPQEFFPQLSITAMAVPGRAIGEVGDNDERFIDNKRLDGTIQTMMDEALAFVRRNIKSTTIIDENGNRRDQSEFPIKAVREVIANALIHRDYSVHTTHSPIRITLFSDRLEVENPGGLYGRITVDDLGKVAADTRNPFIAGALEIMHRTENRFSGIPTVYRELKNAKLQAPLFENKRGVFKVTFFKTIAKDRALDKSSSFDIAQQMLIFCTKPKSREELATQFGFESPYYMLKRYVMPLVAAGKLHLTLPQTPKSKHQRYYSKI